MNFVAVFMTVFAVIGAVDLLIGNKFGLGKEFEKGFMLFGSVAPPVIGMTVIAPLIGNLMLPLSNWLYNVFNIDPSILPAVFFANDMGGYALSSTMARSESLALFNGLIVASMIGCTISFTLPVSLSMVKPEKHKMLLSGFLSGIITIPVGCFAAGLLLRIDIIVLILDLLPLILFSVILAVCNTFFTKACINVFRVFGIILKIIYISGLVLGIIEFLIGIQLVPGLAPFEEGGKICLNSCAVLAGAFPFLFIVSKLVRKPLVFIGNYLKVNSASTFGLFSTLATNLTTFASMDEMDDKGVVLNSAFAISGAFTFAEHLAFTLSINANYVGYMIVGKMISAISALLVATLIYKKVKV